MNTVMIANIGLNFRLICVDWNAHIFKIRVYTEKEPQMMDYELLSVILTEFEGCLKFKRIEEEIKQSDLPMHLLDPLNLSYMPVMKEKSDCFNFNS